ncbi:U-box domain-containing protein [Salix suchowensis]|uniref:RING-type E3 ubiquitin transferase n=1 Tax=Salix koriyanagi TaxID=2511006 RepID=A0A9Q0PH69_9ROSI|nr:U-box domain-containing protein [Salix suchowensis]KAJ6688107.1 U BOX DOMAIN-CONTAINING [Salix koriyanagi]
MGGNGKHRWKISLYSRPKPAEQQQQQQPPKEFLCPISGSLMFDPVVVSSGQTFERLSVQVCHDLGFTPTLQGNSLPDLTTVIPNLAIKSTIQNWCDSSGTKRPPAPDYSSLEEIIREKMKFSSPPASSLSKSMQLSPDIRVSEMELLKGVAENPPVLFSHANTELTRRDNHFYSSSSEESVIVNASAAPSASPLTPLPLSTRPACYSSTSSSSNSIAESETLTLNENPNSTREEDEIMEKLASLDVHDQEQGVISLRKITRTKEETRVSLCTPRLLSALRTLFVSRYFSVQTNAIASLVNLSLEKANKVKIVRSGFVPLLIDVLKGGCDEAQEHAAGALFSLALEDDNKMAIGVLGALQPLMHMLRAESERARHDSSLALYHLSLIQSNRVKLVKLGAVSMLLSMVKSGDLASRLLLVLCNLAACNEGRSAMLDANAVAILVGILREGGGGDSEVIRENCVAALFALSHGSMRFKGLAKEARAVEVLREIEERGSSRAREKAKRVLMMMRGRDEEDEEVCWEEVLESGGISQTRHRVGGRNPHGPNSTNF